MKTIQDFIQNEPFFETHNHQGCYDAYDWSDMKKQAIKEMIYENIRKINYDGTAVVANFNYQRKCGGQL